MSINRGDIFYVNPSETVGSEQRSGRPAIIVSNPLCNEHKGRLTDREMAQVDVALMASLDLHPIPRQAKVRPVGPDVDDAALALIALRFLEGFLQKRCGVTVQDRLSIDLLGQKND